MTNPAGYLLFTEEVPRTDGRTCKVTRRCRLCGNDGSAYVRFVDFEKFVAGDNYVQNLFPYLSADERELLAHGFCGACFDASCPPDDDEAEGES